MADAAADEIEDDLEDVIADNGLLKERMHGLEVRSVALATCPHSTWGGFSFPSPWVALHPPNFVGWTHHSCLGQHGAAGLWAAVLFRGHGQPNGYCDGSAQTKMLYAFTRGAVAAG